MSTTAIAFISLALVCGSCTLIPVLSLVLLLLFRRVGVARRHPERVRDTHCRGRAEHLTDTVEPQEKYTREARDGHGQEEELTSQRREEPVRIVNEIRPHLDRLGKDGKVALHVAQLFVKASAWWLSHSSGHPVPAPGHCRRIHGSEDDWRVEFGNNYFLVGKVIWRCRRRLADFLDQAADGYVVPRSELVEDLVLEVRGAVANGEGYEYRGYYPLGDKKGQHENEMVFGTQSIDTSDFVDWLFEMVSVEALWDDS